jgi:ribosomal protein L11 methyltransferase
MPIQWPKHWVEIKARGTRAAADAAALVLIDAGSPGILEESGPVDGKVLAVSPSDSEEHVEIPTGPARMLTYTAYLPGDIIDKESFLKHLGKSLKKLGWSFVASDYIDRDWSILWRTGIKPVRVTGGKRAVIIRPAWAKLKSSPGDVVVCIDPGMAFGTGGHATTRMCVKAILKLFDEGGAGGNKDGFLDVGTGSGVLAIVASFLGAKRSVGIDIDPIALKVARKNVRINKAKVVISSKTLEGVKGRFSMIAANILGKELVRLAPELARRLKPDGHLIISGILAEEVPTLTGVYRELGLKRAGKFRSGEWAALVLSPAQNI